MAEASRDHCLAEQQCQTKTGRIRGVTRKHKRSAAFEQLRFLYFLCILPCLLHAVEYNTDMLVPTNIYTVLSIACRQPRQRHRGKGGTRYEGLFNPEGNSNEMGSFRPLAGLLCPEQPNTRSGKIW